MESRVNGQSITLNGQHRLLGQLEANGIKPRYQCRNGICSQCRCKLLEGDVIVTDDVLIPIGKNEILPCISIPTSPIVIEFEYDV